MTLSSKPSSPPSSSPTNSNYPSSHPTKFPSTSISPTHNPSSPPSLFPSSSPITAPNAAFMSNSHGISFRLTGGVNYVTSVFDVAELLTQFKDHLQSYGVSWFIINLSSHYYGDRYLAPHSVLTNMSRGSTPKSVPVWVGADLPLESYADRDLFGEILDGFHSLGVKVIAYMSANSPALIETGEFTAYDYDGKSPYVDTCVECPSLTFIPSDCACAPSVLKWIRHVESLYGVNNVFTLQRAYAEIIVAEYAARYSDLAGFWFDRAEMADVPAVRAAVRQYLPRAAVAFNAGQRLPLTNNYPRMEDFTAGLPFWDLVNFPPGESLSELYCNSLSGDLGGWVLCGE